MFSGPVLGRSELEPVVGVVLLLVPGVPDAVDALPDALVDDDAPPEPEVVVPADVVLLDDSLDTGGVVEAGADESDFCSFDEPVVVCVVVVVELSSPLHRSYTHLPPRYRLKAAATTAHTINNTMTIAIGRLTVSVARTYSLAPLIEFFFLPNILLLLPIQRFYPYDLAKATKSLHKMLMKQKKPPGHQQR